MAKKKTSTKKHKFKYAEQPSSRNESPAEGLSTPVAGPRPRLAVVDAMAGRDFGYVGQDLRRIGLMAVSLVALEVILWYVFSSTGVGQAVYKLVQI